MPMNTGTEYLFASGCFNKAKNELNQTDKPPRERLIAALQSLSRVVAEDLPVEARSSFEIIRKVIQAYSAATAASNDDSFLPDVVNNMPDAELDTIQLATLKIAQSVDKHRNPGQSANSASASG